MCNARGYRCVIVMPDNQSPEKYQLLETLGAEVHPVPAVPYSNPNQYQKVAQCLAASLPNAIWSNQFDNTSNRDAHARTTGPEIWAQTQGRVDAFVAATGTGGTLAGVATYLKSQRREIHCVLADPPGSSLYEYIRSGTLKATGSGSITEGIGIGRVTANLAGAPIDDAVHIEDAETVACVYRLLRPAASTSPPRCASRASSDPGTPWSPCCVMAERGTSRAFSTANGCSKKASQATRRKPPAGRPFPSQRSWSPDRVATGAEHARSGLS